MRQLFIAIAASFALTACATQEARTVVTPSSPNIVAALADTRRPEADRARDALRQPAEMLAFGEIEPGDRVADILPGGGYFTRIFAVAVGDQGRVFPVIRPPETASQWETPILEVAALYPNATMARTPFTELSLPEPVDVVFTAQNYHDLHIAQYNMGDANLVNRAAFNALKPGGLYVVIDHSAADGAGDAALEIHRIEQARVRREVEAAGFVFDGELQVLRNPEDPRTQNVFDDAIRGRTDQFVMRFRKPG